MKSAVTVYTMDSGREGGEGGGGRCLGPGDSRGKSVDMLLGVLLPAFNSAGLCAKGGARGAGDGAQGQGPHLLLLHALLGCS